MARRERILFVCTANVDRSPTAETLYACDPRYEVLSAGVALYAVMPIDERILRWADRIFVMNESQDRHRSRIAERFPGLDRPVVDLDVEEPNLHLFLKPQITCRETASMEVPVVDASKCTYCRACADLCQFKAISVMGSVILTFPDMCHGCGGCIAVCPEKALTPTGFAFPEALSAMVAAARAGDWARVRQVYQRFLPLIVFEQQPGVAVRKEILKLRGLIRSSRARHPGAGIQPAVAKQLADLIAAILPGEDISRPLKIS